MGEKFHERLARIASERQLSQRQLANVCGITPASMNQWFSGKTKSYDAMAVSRLANFLGMTTNQLLFGEDRQPHKMYPDAVCSDGVVSSTRPSGPTPIPVGVFELNLGDLSFHPQENPFGIWLYNASDKFKAYIVNENLRDPLFQRDDIVVIDTGNTHVIPGDVYALFYGERFLILTLLIDESSGTYVGRRGEDKFSMPMQQTTIVGRVCNCVRVMNY